MNATQLSVGLPESFGYADPQIHFIPDNDEVNSEIKPELFARIKRNAIRRFNKQNRGIQNLFR
jgi:hypothetical protein